ncbi:hypothetical protein F4813DRAFT_394316 [Daldinia decipiens]|uniref:uncharacterized protein n=1 Tax=Daldinia decipiens TaxID=326647 RepID=UPI0020C35A65|nr:uncharacterized protein F4813DRAFT_394316 [Daldinia decipiens]KAI1652768.1 hypothetical protein F4813DRAFT_394316 [Daldinia decipiens]
MPEYVDLFGPTDMPSSWWDKWESRSEYYTETRDPIPERAKYGQVVSPGAELAIYDTPRPMLALNPDDRCTAAEVLESNWMTQWALPEYQKLKK